MFGGTARRIAVGPTGDWRRRTRESGRGRLRRFAGCRSGRRPRRPSRARIHFRSIRPAQGCGGRERRTRRMSSRRTRDASPETNCTNAVDTNVLFYARDTREPAKREVAASLVEALEDGVLPPRALRARRFRPRAPKGERGGILRPVSIACRRHAPPAPGAGSARVCGSGNSCSGSPPRFHPHPHYGCSGCGRELDRRGPWQWAWVGAVPIRRSPPLWLGRVPARLDSNGHQITLQAAPAGRIQQ